VWHSKTPSGIRSQPLATVRRRRNGGAPGWERVYPASTSRSRLLDDLVCDGQSRCLESLVYRLTRQLDIGAIGVAINQVIAPS